MELPEGWIAHDGGKCPVALHSMPGVMFPDGEIERPGAWRADFWCAAGNDWWKHQGPPESRIIAYKPEPSP